MRYDDGDALVLGLKEGYCSMGPLPQPCSPIPIDKQNRKRNDDDDSKDFPFAKRPKFQPPISRSSELSTAPPSKDGPAPSPQIVPINKEDDDNLMVKFSILGGIDILRDSE